MRGLPAHGQPVGRNEASGAVPWQWLHEVVAGGSKSQQPRALTGPVEGHIHRLKLLKRMGYGPAQVPQLRARPAGEYAGRHGKITQETRAEEGRALCLWGDAGWGRLVRAGKYEDNHFDDQLALALADNASAVTGTCPRGPVLLVDDIVDSRWTLTICAVLLREAGSGPVFPVALASAAGGGDPD